MTLTVAHFPDIDELSENPYWTILRLSQEQQGLKIDSSMSREFGRRWLLNNRGRVQVLHFHYIQRLYAFEWTQARLRWVLRFVSNLLIARALRYRTVLTFHNATPTYPLQPAWIDQLAHWATIKLVDSVLVHCEAARQLLKDRYKRHKHVYSIIHPHFINQYPNEMDQLDARACLGIAPDDLVFAFIGSIRPNKGVESLIASFMRLDGEKMRLIIAGKPWPPTEHILALEQFAKQDARIVLHKRLIPDQELQIYFNAADVIVLPFARILTSSSAILAMGFARPVLAPAMGCLPELVAADIGILYDPEMASGLLQALSHCRTIDRTKLHEMGAEAKQRVMSFTGQLMAETTLRAYRMTP